MGKVMLRDNLSFESDQPAGRTFIRIVIFAVFYCVNDQWFSRVNERKGEIADRIVIRGPVTAHGSGFPGLFAIGDFCLPSESNLAQMDM
jgi:hypothetical protein